MNMATDSPSDESTSEWIETTGGKMVSLATLRIEAEEEEMAYEEGEAHPDISEATPLGRQENL